MDSPGTRDGRRKACRECRQQKIRCDAQQRQPQQCTRCKRMGLDCIILPTSAKSSRRTKADLQRELDSLKTKVQKGSLLEDSQSSYSPPEDPHPKNVVTPGEESQTPDILTSEFAPRPSEISRTESRTLNGNVVDAQKIDDCFSLFFQCYHPIFPILEAELTPNDCYKTSRFLFWIVVTTGSRRYSKDPTLLQKLQRHAYSLSFSAIQSHESPIPTIQGLLLMCLWPMPVNSVYKDITSILGGAAMHLAILAGLHVVGAGHEFLEDKIVSDPAQKEIRGRLWMYIQAACQTTSVAQGMPPMLVGDATSTINQHEELYLSKQPESVQFRWKCHRLFLSSFTAISRSIHQAGNNDQSNMVGSMVSLFDSQLSDFGEYARTDLDRLIVLISRIHVMAFYFFEPRPTINMEGLVRAWSVALAFVNTIMELDRKMNYVSYWPALTERTCTLTAIVILRIVRSNIAHHFDVEAGERAFFNIVGAMKRAALQPGDLRTRACAILSKLWANHDVFRYADGRTDSLRTRIRSRLSMSVVFDCFLWYKDTALDKFERVPSTQDTASDGDAGGSGAPSSSQPALSAAAAAAPAAAAPAGGPSTSPSAGGNDDDDDDDDIVMAAVPLPMALPDSGLELDHGAAERRPPPPLLGADPWMVPDYDWAASFALGADDLPQLPQVPWLSRNMRF